MCLCRFLINVWLIVISFQVFATQKILILGDSISSAYGMEPEQGWVNLLSSHLSEKGLPYEVINASIAGDTAANGKLRLVKALEEYSPKIVVLELGGNDGLRGYPIEQIENDLHELIKMCEAKGAKVLLVGMEIPANLGSVYTNDFAKMYLRISHDAKVPLVHSVAHALWVAPNLMQSDGIHPSAEAQPIIFEAIWKPLAPLLTSVTKAAAK